MNETKVEILYMGDAKAETGLLRLPNLLQKKTTEVSEAEFVVQCASNNDPSLNEAEELVERISLHWNRVRLMRRFLNHDEMEQIFNEVGSITFDYHKQHYAEKTSGLLWLALRRNLAVNAPIGTWLYREATNLTGDSWGSVGKRGMENSVDDSYCRTVFADVSQWLDVNFREEARC